MVALTSKNLSLPHLSLSRTSSPSRSNSLNSNPPTPTSSNPTPTSTAPTSPALPLPTNSNASSSSFFSLDRKKSKSTSPKHRPVVDKHLTPIEPLSSSASTSTSLRPDDHDKDKDKDKDKATRRTSFGASLSGAFSNSSSTALSNSLTSRSTSQTGTKSSTLPAGLSLTPASAHLTHQNLSPGSAGRGIPDGNGNAHTPTMTTTTTTGGGFKPLQAVIAKSAGVVKDRSGALLMRSKSSDRAEGISAANSSDAKGSPIEPKKKGVMGTVRGLALGQSVSQPAQSRSSSSPLTPNLNALGGGIPHGPVRAASSHPSSASQSGTTTPISAEQLTSASRSALANSQVHQLAESHVSQISLRMSETVNKVFMPSAHGAAGQQQDKLEGCFFVPSSAVQEATGGKGRPCPRVVRSREFGEMIIAELRAAVHDSYLLRTILRSSVLKALSLFLSRLSALLLVPASPDDASFVPPVSLSMSKDPKNQETDQQFATNFPLALRYNLHIVRCATTVKQYLLELATVTTASGGGFPSFVEETLRPWRGKLTELIGRVMNPIVGSYKSAVTEACRKSRIQGGYTDQYSALPLLGGGATRDSRGRANSGERSSSALGLSGVPRSASQGRSLSLGRSNTPTPLALSSTVSTASGVSHNGGSGGNAAGPAWLQEVVSIFDVCSRLFARLEAKSDTDRWAVGIAIAATWKGMLGCSARIIAEDGIIPSSGSMSPVSAGLKSNGTTTGGNAAVPAPVKSRLLGGVKKTPSPPPSPDLPAVSLAASASAAGPHHDRQSPSPATVAFVRLISDLELFEHRLTSFLTSVLSSPGVVFHPSAAPVEACPGEPSCGLCRTGRTFDEESDSSDEEGHSNEIPGKESRLALSAMREAMQALSSMIVVVRASRDLKVLERALQADTIANATSSPPRPQNTPLTPSDLFALGPAKPTDPPSSSDSTALPVHTTSVTVVSPSPAHPFCPTLRSAIIDLHPLILLHLMLSRLPRSLPFRLPHEIWALREGWNEYESELRGFAAGEEWAGEVAWEVRSEIVRVRQDSAGRGRSEGHSLSSLEENALKVLEETVERVSRDSA